MIHYHRCHSTNNKEEYETISIVLKKKKKIKYEHQWFDLKLVNYYQSEYKKYLYFLSGTAELRIRIG